MRLRRLLILLVLGATAVLLFLFFNRQPTQAAFGPAVALCPGPDLYGYRCEAGTVFSYIDAAEDIRLYDDDGVAQVDLPFVFTFYGTPYTEIAISTNGNVQFGSQNPAYFNDCLNNGPIPSMGDMIAPLWDDMDSTQAGSIDIETTGEAPNRIFVVEWDDIPMFGGELENSVTFELQLFEVSDDILFLYEDVEILENRNGRSATIGIQSANQGVALQYGCNQAVVSDASRLTMRHPERANADLGQETILTPAAPPLSLLQKQPLNDLTTQLNLQGASALLQWQQGWLNAPSPQMASWEWVDLTGNGRRDLLLMRNHPPALSDQSSLTLFQADHQGQLSPMLYHPLSTRETAVSSIELLQLTDLTNDGITDALLRTPDDGTYYLITYQNNLFTLDEIPERCGGSWRVRTEENGRQTLIRDGCQTAGRFSQQWDADSGQWVVDE